MDRGRCLVLLSASDAAAYSAPLVGCWVAGGVDVRHPLVAAACLRFLTRRVLPGAREKSEAVSVDARHRKLCAAIPPIMPLSPAYAPPPPHPPLVQQSGV